MKWVVRGFVALVALYVAFFGAVLAAMLQPPDRFGLFMRYAPAPLVWMTLPAERMWLWARDGPLRAGDPAPDFTLPALDGSRGVTLSSHRARRPVVLVFGSYT